MLIFNNALNTHVETDIEKRLKDNIEPNIVSFNLQVSEQIKKVNTFADFLGKNWELGQEMHLTLLQSAAQHNGLLRCALAYPDGSFITHDNKNNGNVTSDAFFIANMKGEFFITDPRPAVVDETKRVILFSAPIKVKDKIVGSIVYSYLCDDMNKIFNLESMGGEMNMMVAKANGEILIGKTTYAQGSANILQTLRADCTHKKHAPNVCLSLDGTSGMHQSTSPNLNGSLYLRYDKLNYNDWYLISTIPSSAATAGMSFAIEHQRTLSAFIALLVFGYLCFISIMWLTQLKTRDKATGALTLYAFKKKAKKIFKHRTNDLFVVVKLDVKDFKLVNRIHSFAMGDKLIKNIALALRYVLNDSKSLYSRIGVDTFVLLLPYNGVDALNEQRLSFITRFRELMDENLSAKIIFPTGQYVLQPSDFPKPDIDDILEKVNFAHRAAKQNSDVIIDYTADIERAAMFQKSVEDKMESAILNREFTLYLQAKIHLKTATLIGAEALVRWELDGKIYKYPSDFVPILEKNGFIVQLDKYMFKCTVEFIRKCIDDGIEPVSISVNFSRHHLDNCNFVKELCEIADSYNVPHHFLEIELTESAFLGNIENTIGLISNLHLQGFTISMDDFGSGYSCFAQLKDLNIDVLKIDRGFFARNDDEGRARVVIAGILKIAQELSITTVAEGIESKQQVDMLQELGCDIVQGYYFAKPVPASELDVANFSVKAI